LETDDVRLTARDFFVHNGQQNGADEIRTHDLLHAMQALSQLSYGPGQRYQLSVVSYQLSAIRQPPLASIAHPQS
jgi:hypothetical protein